MVHRRLILMVVTGALLLATTAQPALATRPPISRPLPPPLPPPGTEPAPEPDPRTAPEAPLTSEQRAAAAAKEVAAELYVASLHNTPALDSLACVPTSPEPASAPASAFDATAASGGPATDGGTAASGAPVGVAVTPQGGCGSSVPQDYLPVEARDQINWFYCGPAVAQVIANYSWAVRAGTNAFTQQQIASWMGTDWKGSTSAPDLVHGLERGTAGSPRRPANWAWVVTEVWDSDRDGWVGDQVDAYVRSNISGSRMPLAFAVKPHDANAPNGAHLASWPNPVNSVGHWVAIYGWYRVHDGSDRARLYYTDSSRDEGGATGTFWTSTWWFTILILDHTRRIVW